MNTHSFKKTSLLLTVIWITLHGSPLVAGDPPSLHQTQDSDLSGNTEFQTHEEPLSGTQLKPDSVVATDLSIPNQSLIRVVRKDHGQLQPIVGLRIESPTLDEPLITSPDGTAEWMNCAPRTTFRAQVKLKNAQLTVAQDSDPYQFTFQVNCGTEVVVTAEESSNFGQALSIWTLTESARQKLANTVGLGFWTKNLTFVWPEEADYYSFGTVHISRGDHWDVVLHEMGHAIYDMGKIGAFGGGQHKIDECYSPALALSEGWASYFAAWAALDLGDPDAKFEFMVPRRAPIRFENVPGDVCKGPTNEWRVTAFLWDLIDTHEDGESVSQGFKDLWGALQNTRSASIGAASQKLRNSGIPKNTLDQVWEQNFLTSPLQFDADVLILAPLRP